MVFEILQHAKENLAMIVQVSLRRDFVRCQAAEKVWTNASNVRCSPIIEQCEP